jgi:hypothetical protein
MIALHTIVTTRSGETGEVIGREPLTGGGVIYRVRLADGRVRPFGGMWLSVAVAPVVRMPVRLRLVVVDGERIGA